MKKNAFLAAALIAGILNFSMLEAAPVVTAQGHEHNHDSTSHNGNRVTHTVKNGAQATAHSAKKVGKGTAKGVKKAGKAVGKTAKKGGEKVKEAVD